MWKFFIKSNSILADDESSFLISLCDVWELLHTFFIALAVFDECVPDVADEWLDSSQAVRIRRLIADDLFERVE